MRKQIVMFMCLVWLLIFGVSCTLHEEKLYDPDVFDRKTEETSFIELVPPQMSDNTKDGVTHGVQAGINVDNNNAFLVVTQNYSERSISINYPQIEYLDDTDRETVINEKFKEIFISLYKSNWNWDEMSVAADFQTTLNDECYISFLCSSEPYVAGTAHLNCPPSQGQ